MLQTVQLHSVATMSPHQLFRIIAPAEIALWVVAESFGIHILILERSASFCYCPLARHR